jgi:glycosyltransferase involved in cell wall biosynthesis
MTDTRVFDTAVPARPLHACMVAYTFYEGDGRVMRYANALVQSGATVDAIVLGRPGQPAVEVIDGVCVRRVQARTKNERGRAAYLWRLLRFLLRSAFELACLQWRRPYDLVHVHSVPDFEVFAALVPRLFGARVILDIHDILPEFYAARFGVRERSPAYRLLLAMERWSARFAHHVIIANDLWLERLVERSVARDKVSAFINYPDLAVFRTGLRRRGGDGRFVVSYPGSLNHHQGLDVAIRAIALVRGAVPEIELHIHGEGPVRAGLASLVAQLDLGCNVFLHEPCAQREIARVMADADVGVVPKRNDAFGGDAFSTKILEFMALGVPVVVARTRIDAHYFDDAIVNFFEPGDEHDLARALLAVRHDGVRAAARAQRALAHARASAWSVNQGRYLGLVDRLVHAAR